MKAWATTATPRVVAITSPIDSNPIVPRVFAQVPQGREERRRVEQRRQHDQQDEVGLEGDRRHAWREAQHQPAEHEHDRIRDVRRLAGDHQRGRGDQDAEDDELGGARLDGGDREQGIHRQKVWPIG